MSQFFDVICAFLHSFLVVNAKESFLRTTYNTLAHYMKVVAYVY